MNTIGILELSLSGGLLILAVILLRALALDRLPKGTFLALWLVAAIRLLVPVSIPSPLSVYSLVRRAPEMPAAMAPAAGPAVAVLPVLTGTETEAVPGAPAVPLWETVWLAGALVCGGFFLLSYLRCRREYRTALPVGEELRERCRDRLGRRIALRQSDRVAAPLTYGLFHPVILLPRDFDPSDGERLDYVLEHELVHIRRLDGLTKLVQPPGLGHAGPGQPGYRAALRRGGGGPVRAGQAVRLRHDPDRHGGAKERAGPLCQRLQQKCH